jgi:hypothetical protein
MRPRVCLNGGPPAFAITVLIVELEPTATLDLLRHVVRKTHDPRERYERGLRVLSSEYYEEPGKFSGVLTAQFPAESAVAARLVMSGRCELHFEQSPLVFRIPCAASQLLEGAPFYEFTYWHNLVFNPNPTPRVQMLVFDPDWDRAAAPRPLNSASSSPEADVAWTSEI